MSNSNDFIFISPIPYPIRYPSPQNGIEINLTPKECVEFFWQLKSVSINASLSVFAREIGASIPIWNNYKSTFLDTLSSNCTTSLSMPKRALSSAQGFCYVSNDSARFQITGPFLLEDYPEEYNFTERNYIYSCDFQFGVGCIEISSQFLTPRPTSGLDNFYTIKRFPFKIFEKTYYLNLNVPHSIIHPEQFNLEAHYSGNAEVSFNF